MESCKKEMKKQFDSEFSKHTSTHPNPHTLLTPTHTHTPSADCNTIPEIEQRGYEEREYLCIVHKS
jgi:hypothetical protein